MMFLMQPVWMGAVCNEWYSADGMAKGELTENEQKNPAAAEWQPIAPECCSWGE